MKFNDNVISILQNFSTINQSIVFKPGKTLATMAPTKSILARATIDFEIEKEFGIYDLNKLLTNISCFKSPEIVVEDSGLTIVEGEKVFLPFAEPKLIIQPPEKSIKLPTVDVEFELETETLKRAIKMVNVNSSPELAIAGEDGELNLLGLDVKNNVKNYTKTIGETSETFKAVFTVENLKLLPMNYTVQLSNKGLARFFNDNMEYFIAIDTTSSWS